MKVRTQEAIRGLAVAALLLGGTLACKSSGGVTNSYTFSEGAHESSVNIGSSTLARHVEVVEPRSVRVEDGRLLAQFDVMNRRSSQLRVEYKVEWFDAAGFEVETIENWTPVVIGGKGSETVTLSAPTPSVVRWRVQVRRPNEIG